MSPITLPPEERSAKYPGRPIFNDMMTRIEAGEASHIAVWALSRFHPLPRGLPRGYASRRGV